MAGADDHEVALADFDALLLGAGIEVGIGDRVTVIERLHALEARDVEQHATAGHLVAHVLDAELLRAARIDELGVDSHCTSCRRGRCGRARPTASRPDTAC